MHQVDWWWLQADPYLRLSCWCHSDQRQLPPPNWRWVQQGDSFWSEGVKQKSHTEMFPPLCVEEELIGRKLQSSLISELGDIQKHLVNQWMCFTFGLWPKCLSLALWWVLERFGLEHIIFGGCARTYDQKINALICSWELKISPSSEFWVLRGFHHETELPALQWY